MSYRSAIHIATENKMVGLSLILFGLLATEHGSAAPTSKNNQIVTVHFLFKERLPSEPAPYFEDHVAIQLLDGSVMTVKDLADFIVETRSAYEQDHEQQGKIMYPDPYEKVNVMYIEKHNKPFFSRTKANHGGDVDFSRWMKDRTHIHVYAYKPTDPRLPANNQQSRTIQLIHHAKQGGQSYVDTYTLNTAEDKTPVLTVLAELLKTIREAPPFNDYPKNQKFTKLWYSDGTIFYDDGKDNAGTTMEDQLAKGGFSTEKLLLVYNFDPTKKFPWDQ